MRIAKSPRESDSLSVATVTNNVDSEFLPASGARKSPDFSCFATNQGIYIPGSPRGNNVAIDARSQRQYTSAAIFAEKRQMDLPYRTLQSGTTQ